MRQCTCKASSARVLGSAHDPVDRGSFQRRALGKGHAATPANDRSAAALARQFAHRKSPTPSRGCRTPSAETANEFVPAHYSNMRRPIAVIQDVLILVVRHPRLARPLSGGNPTPDCQLHWVRCELQDMGLCRPLQEDAHEYATLLSAIVWSFAHFRRVFRAQRRIRGPARWFEDLRRSTLPTPAPLSLEVPIPREAGCPWCAAASARPARE